MARARAQPTQRTRLTGTGRLCGGGWARALLSLLSTNFDLVRSWRRHEISTAVVKPTVDVVLPQRVLDRFQTGAPYARPMVVSQWFFG